MSNIRTYDDLLIEKLMLENKLADQRKLIREDISELREELKPVRNLISFVGKVTTKTSSNPLLAAGVGMAGELLIKRLLTGGSGWLAGLVVPAIKNYAGQFLGRKKPNIFQRFAERLRKD